MSQKTYASLPLPTGRAARVFLSLVPVLVMVLAVSGCSSAASNTTAVAIDVSDTEQSMSDLAGDDTSATGITVNGTSGNGTSGSSTSESGTAGNISDSDAAVPFPTGSDTSVLQPPESSSPANRQAAQDAHSSSQPISSTASSSTASSSTASSSTVGEDQSTGNTDGPAGGNDRAPAVNPASSEGQSSQTAATNSTGQVTQAPTFVANANSTGAPSVDIAGPADDQPSPNDGAAPCEGCDGDEMASLEPTDPGTAASTRSPAALQNNQNNEQLLNQSADVSNQLGSGASDNQPELSAARLAQRQQDEELLQTIENEIGGADARSEGQGVTEQRVAADPDCENRPWAFGCDGPAPDPDDLASFQSFGDNSDTAGVTNGAESNGAGAAGNERDDTGTNTDDTDTAAAISPGPESGVVVPQEVIDALLAPVPGSTIETSKG